MRTWNFALAVARFVADGCRTVTREQYRRRLAICQPCDARKAGRCTRCDCWIQLKARLRSEDCPRGRWPDDN